jgi:Do/DeqQ family serine protease
MKNKFFMAAAVIVAAAIAGGASAWFVARADQDTRPTNPSATVVESGFEGAGAHFTSYTPQNYPDLTYAAENAVKAVVGVIKTEEIPQQTFGGRNPFFEFFGIPEGYEGYEGDSRGSGRRYREQQSGGSGVIISPDGYIVTNHHVVVNASKLTVKLPDGKTYDATLVGTDADTEVALLKIDAKGLPSIPFGSSDALRLGEWVLAIGNPFNLRSTITAGIVSAKARSLGAIQSSGNSGGIESFIQTDAAVNPGNSGGALVNTAGELVGINTLLISPTQTYAGYSFAIPETIVRKVVADLREYGLVQRALIGIEYRVIDEAFIEQMGEETGITETGGIYVANVVEEGAARAAGIRKGDIITSIDGRPTNDIASVAEVVSMKRPGDAVKISAKRGGSVKQFDVVLRNRTGKSELLSANTYDAFKALGGEYRVVTLSNREKKELGIDGGIQVVAINDGGILARAGVRREYIITHINGREIRTVNDLNRITEEITSIDGVYPNGRAITYSFSKSEE